MTDRLLDVLNLGAGIQSSTLFLMSCRGLLPRFDAAVFADTKWEPEEVYLHLAWLEDEGKKAGIAIHRVSAGNLRQDAIDFRRLRASADGKRWASMPLFIKNPDGSQGRVKRQCTKEYKIEPCERFMRRVLLGLKPRQRSPRTVRIRNWFGISSDESGRAKPPGRWEKKEVHRQAEMFGAVATAVKGKVWKPIPWKCHVYPLLDWILHPDRKGTPANLLGRSMSRSDCKDWLAANYPGRRFPRSACLGCPFRTNEEWRLMRDEDPEGWKDAVAFDHEIRQADEISMANKVRRRVGAPFVHRQMIPLDLVNLDGDGEKQGGGCGSIFGEDDGHCGL